MLASPFGVRRTGKLAAYLRSDQVLHHLVLIFFLDIDEPKTNTAAVSILGNLFTWKRKDNRINSLIIMITPHILKDAGNANELFRKAEREHRERDYFWNKYERDDKKDDGA